jgi:hypothetical protein
LLLGLIELLNEVGGKRTLGSGLRGRHNNAPDSFQDQVRELAATPLQWPQHRNGANSEWVGWQTQCQKSHPRSRKKRAQVFSVPAAEKFERKLACPGVQDEAHS